MEELTTSHNALLIVMSCVVAIIAGFTGLSLTRNLSVKPMAQKQASVALAAIALGGGIWAMHFVAMLGLKLPILFYYDAAITLVSALTAILIVGAALILLHFAKRTPLVITAAGGIIGAGILVMHYIGMAGLELCRPVYTLPTVFTSSIVAIGLCILAIWVAYGHRTNRNIFLGTLCFAAAVVSVHFLAMAGTSFVADQAASELGPSFGPSISNETMALGVVFFSFVIFGACLWVSVTYLVPPETPKAAAPAPATEVPAPEPQPDSPARPPVAKLPPVTDPSQPDPPPAPVRLNVPCERDGKRWFVPSNDILFLRADGHYTQVYTNTEQMFCSWPITEATKRLLPEGFLQSHRSYLINPRHVARFEKQKDKGRCIFDGKNIPPAPVSRSKLKPIQDALST